MAHLTHLSKPALHVCIALYLSSPVPSSSLFAHLALYLFYNLLLFQVFLEDPFVIKPFNAQSCVNPTSFYNNFEWFLYTLILPLHCEGGHVPVRGYYSVSRKYWQVCRRL